MEKVVLSMDRYGNTSAASIPLALDEAVRGGRVKAGSLVMIEAFGSGVTWASAGVRRGEGGVRVVCLGGLFVLRGGNYPPSTGNTDRNPAKRPTSYQKRR